MSINERINRAEANRRWRNDQARQDYLERRYSMGWRPDMERPRVESRLYVGFENAMAVIAAIAIAVIAVRWVWS